MPECFKADYPDCRVIIDCSEVRSQKPGGTDEQFIMYSHYKSGHTIKFLVAIAPNGMFSFTSLAYGGRTSDTFITGDCGLVDLLEPFDVVLADKGFPTLKCDDIITIIPPRGKSGQHATEEQMALTRKIAKYRIHVERSLQRFKIYNIFSNTFHHSMLPEVNKIIHICAVLANLQPPIIKNSSGQSGAEEEEDEGEPESDSADW